MPAEALRDLHADPKHTQHFDAKQNGEGLASPFHVVQPHPWVHHPDEVAASCDGPIGRHPWSACVVPSTSWWDSIYAGSRSAPIGRTLELL
jgi:hypothetical protein